MKKPVLFALAVALVVTVSIVTARAAEDTMPKVGQAAPGFTLPSQTGAPISLESYKGKWVVLYFYPRDMTSGCTIEAHNFQNAQSQFDAKNAVILGVSVDSTASHQQFCAKDGLTFHLLSDTSHTVVSAYGSLGNFNGVSIANRNTFLINPQGSIAQVWTGVNPATAASTVLGAIPGSADIGAPSSRDSVKPPGPQDDHSTPGTPASPTKLSGTSTPQ
ncbi:MAG: peroxiredoxin [Terracidiphilus sp.]